MESSSCISHLQLRVWVLNILLACFTLLCNPCSIFFSNNSCKKKIIFLNTEILKRNYLEASGMWWEREIVKSRGSWSAVLRIVFPLVLGGSLLRRYDGFRGSWSGSRIPYLLEMSKGCQWFLCHSVETFGVSACHPLDGMCQCMSCLSIVSCHLP